MGENRGSELWYIYMSYDQAAVQAEVVVPCLVQTVMVLPKLWRTWLK